MASATRFGAFRYFVLPFINTLALSPISRSEDPNLAFAISEGNRQYSVRCLSKAEKSFLLHFAMLHILRNDSLRTCEGVLRLGERNSMPSPIDLILSWVPFEVHRNHATIYSYILTAIPGMLWLGAYFFSAVGGAVAKRDLTLTSLSEGVAAAPGSRLPNIDRAYSRRRNGAFTS